MEVLILKTLLLLTNFSLLTYLLMLVIHHYQSNYDKKSWAFLFHILTFLWLVFRGFFWLSTLTSLMKWSSAIFFVLYWMPTPIEFGAFMLLPLYFAQILYPDEWKKYWIYARPVYFGLTIGIFVFQSLWSLLKPTSSSPDAEHCENVVDDYYAEECFRTENSTSAFRWITAICFLFLASIQCWFGVKVLKMDDKNRYEQFLNTTPEMLSMVNILLVVSFASRSFYQIMAINELMILPDVPLQPNDGDVELSIFLACELWIYIPTALVLVTFTSRGLGNIQLTRPEYYFPTVSNYGSTDLINDELEYESLLREVPSRQGSFWTGKAAKHSSNSERIPIKVGNIEGGEIIFTSSFPRTQSWLSEPSRPTSLDAKSGSIGKEGISLLTHYKKFRQRGWSAGSDASSVEGGGSSGIPSSGPATAPGRITSHIPAGKKSAGKSGRRNIRYYNEKKSFPSSLNNLVAPSLLENDSDHSSSSPTQSHNHQHTLMKLSGEDDEQEEEEEILTDTNTHGADEEYMSSHMNVQMMHGTMQDKQYELMVEPPSPSPHSSYIQESEYLALRERKESFRGIDSIRISSYEATGGDHIHGTHLTHTTHPLHLNAHQRELSYYTEDNSPTLLNYHHNRNEVGAKDSKQEATSLAMNPIYPRPTRHNPSNHIFHPTASKNPAPDRVIELPSSYSPSVMERTRSVDNTSTPDRNEAAMEATLLRQGMGGSRYSPN